ncbi:MAG: hypothetical protein K6U14_06855 [Firmicutes bacterium]|nr:hypothetical protein [Alicyclobacillaceae bacterium]MCL6497338.1 hypothetical protein [Bacillota bacterium]
MEPNARRQNAEPACSVCGTRPAWVRIERPGEEGRRARRLCYQCAVAEVHHLLMQQWLHEDADAVWPPAEEVSPWHPEGLRRAIQREDLEEALEVAIACEAYELAAQIRDWLRQRKESADPSSPLLHWDR